MTVDRYDGALRAASSALFHSSPGDMLLIEELREFRAGRIHGPDCVPPDWNGQSGMCVCSIAVVAQLRAQSGLLRLMETAGGVVTKPSYEIMERAAAELERAGAVRVLGRTESMSEWLDTPTDDGWYWHRWTDDGYLKTPTMTYAFRREGEWFARSPAGPIPLDRVGGSFCGPLQPPTGDKT